MKTDYKGIIVPDFLVIMVYLEDGGKCMSDLNRELDITYKHLHELKHTFLKLGWVAVVKDNRRHNLYLTHKGQEIVSIANEMLNSMDFNKSKIMKYIQKSKLKTKTKVNINKIKKEMDEIQNVKN